MGFRTGAYTTIWSVDPVSDVQTKARISISRKNKQTGEYETDFSGFVSFFGTAAAKKAASLKERDRIKLGDVDVHSFYSKEKNITYYNFNIFSFEIADGATTQSPADGSELMIPEGDTDDAEYNLPF